MDFKTILVDLGDDAARDARIAAAAVLAANSDGVVVGLTALGARMQPFAGAGAEAGHYAVLQDEGLKRLAARDADAMRSVLERIAPGVRSAQVVVEAEAGWALTTHGRAADIVLPAPPSADETAPAPMAKAAEYALLHAGRPMLLVPPQTPLKTPLSLDGHAVVAWNGRREASRALADALPLLALASRVTILVLVTDGGMGDEGASDLVPWLARHGLDATIRVEACAAADDALLRIVSDVQPALLVAGGYGHSRLGELIVGGTTRTLLRRCTVPLFMSH
ncbi:hypothetical protein SAMN05216345_103376 [Cupriavidus sp. YR651]|uniref:universal stress protein n=1 Tax=Cupriavidus sp. YR651 TaxID=1855315 RepID=UPI00087FD9A1|nr:universal stress protein [Cupriavidus sp. YR651]SDC71042.1 hypothetical protein SAMN05216345_103376 [Cupriavidus sp. YR651]